MLNIDNFTIQEYSDKIIIGLPSLNDSKRKINLNNSELISILDVVKRFYEDLME